MDAKLTYIKLNSQAACPPRAAVPVNQGCCGRFFHSQHPDRLRSWLRPFLLCPAKANMLFSIIYKFRVKRKIYYRNLDVDHTVDRQGRVTSNTYDAIRELLSTI